MTLQEQFKNYLENQINNPMYTSGEDERDIPFTNYEEIKEESIFLVAVSNGQEFKFESNCYFSGTDYDLYEFEIYEGAFC